MSEETVSAASDFSLDDFCKMLSEVNKDGFDKELYCTFETYQDFTCKQILPSPILNWDALMGEGVLLPELPNPHLIKKEASGEIPVGSPIRQTIIIF